MIALEAQVRIVNLEKKRIEEECQKLRDENGVYRERLTGGLEMICTVFRRYLDF